MCDLVLEGLFRHLDPTDLVRRHGPGLVQLALDVTNHIALVEYRPIANPPGFVMTMLNRGVILPPRGFVPREQRGRLASSSSATSPTSPLSPPRPRSPYSPEEVQRREAERRAEAEREARNALIEARRSALTPEELCALEARARTSVLAESEIAWKRRLGISAPPMNPELLALAVRVGVNRLLVESQGVAHELPS